MLFEWIAGPSRCCSSQVRIQCGPGGVVPDNRSATRHPVSIPVKLSIDGTSIDGTLMNLSLGGALVSSGTKHPMGQRVSISFKVPTAEQAIEVGATVRWTDSEGVG